MTNMQTLAKRELTPQEVFATFDRLDDDQIIAEMKGAALDAYVYEFNEGGQTVRGLSKVGTDDASRIMAVRYGEALREIDVTLEFQDENIALFKAKVARYIIKDDGTALEMDSAIGQKAQPKKVNLRAGGTKANQFWYEQGGQKALRNAKQKLMPETIKQAIIAAYVEQGKVRKVKPEDIGPVEANGQPQPAEEQHWCPIHNVAFRRMTSKTDPSQHWYSHKADDGSWCNEKSKAEKPEPPAPAKVIDEQQRVPWDENEPPAYAQPVSRVLPQPVEPTIKAKVPYVHNALCPTDCDSRVWVKWCAVVADAEAAKIPLWEFEPIDTATVLYMGKQVRARLDTIKASQEYEAEAEAELAGRGKLAQGATA